MFRKYTQNIIEREGGFSNHPADAGMETNYGITLATLAEYRKWDKRDIARLNDITDPHPNRAKLVHMLKTLTLDSAISVYHELFYRRYNIRNVPNCIQENVYDMCVNSGRMGIRLLQKLLQKHGHPLRIDGYLGAKSADAVNAYIRRKGENSLKKEYSAMRRAYYITLAVQKPDQIVFVWGWVQRAQKFMPKAAHMTRSELMSLVERKRHAK